MLVTLDFHSREASHDMASSLVSQFLMLETAFILFLDYSLSAPLD